LPAVLPLVPLFLAGVFLLEDSARIGHRRLHWVAANVRGIRPVVLALVESLLLFLPCFRWLAAVGAVVLESGSMVGLPNVLASSGKKICVWTHRLRPDAPGTQDALDAPCQCIYRSQRKTHRQREFGRSSPQHRASECRSPRHLLTGQSVAGHFPSGCTVSGHFHSGRSHVRAFSFWTQPCQGISLLNTAVSGHFPSGRSLVRAFSF